MSRSDSITAARARDLATSAALREYDFVFSRFLSPSEQVEYFTAVREYDASLQQRCFFFGGCPAAERRVCVFVPSYIDTSDVPRDSRAAAAALSVERESFFISEILPYADANTFGITPLEICGSTFKTLTHRDYMGSLLALGLEREVVGDIAVTGDCRAVVFVSEQIAPFIEDSLERVGRDSVNVRRAVLPQDFTVPRRYEKKSVVSASDRLDAVVAALTGESRASSAEYVTSGLVDLCYVTECKTDARVSAGDVVSVRGHGKFIIDSFDGETRSHRARLSVRKYI